MANINDAKRLEEIKKITEIYAESINYSIVGEKEHYMEILKHCNNIYQCIFNIKTSHRLDYLNFLYESQLLTEQECADYLVDFWTMQEKIYRSGLSKAKIIKFLKLASKSPLFQSDVDDMSEYDYLIIHRGVSVNDYRGFSWTVDKSVAEWFAKRFSTSGNNVYVFSGKIKKKDVLVTFDGREEKEIVCDWKKVYDIQRLVINC